MKLPTLKLGTQGILLVVLLLILEFLFVWQYSVLLDSAERESRRLEKQKEIISRGSGLLQDIYDAGDALGKYSIHRLPADKSRYETAVDRIPKTLVWLKNELRNNEAQYQRLDRIDQNLKVGLATLTEMKRNADADPKYVIVLWKWVHLQPRLAALVRDMKGFLRTEREAESLLPDNSKIARQKTKDLLVAGGTANVVLALALALFFVTRLRSRLRVIIQNSDRLRLGQALPAPMRGADEIAAIDVTFHKMVESLRGEEELLRASEQQVRSMIENIPVGLMVVDPSGTIDFSNSTIEHLLKYSPGELINKDISSLFTLDASSGVANQSWMQANSLSRVAELKAVTKTGATLFAELSTTDVSYGDSKKRLAMIVDVTERQQMQQLRRAFVAMVSHELRTPLTSVGAFLEMFEMGMLGEPGADLRLEVARSQSNVSQLILLITDLLDLEKTEADKMPLQPVECIAEDFIDKAIDKVGKLLDEKNVRVHFEGSEIEMSVDEAKMTKALSSLLAGVVRLTGSGETLVIDAKPAGEGFTLVSTRSATLSLTQSQRDLMFERFQRVETNGITQSLGLGFALCRAIVQRHGGAVGVDKDEDGGTVFWLRLPNSI